MLREYRIQLFMALVGLLLLEAYAVVHPETNLEYWLLPLTIIIAGLTAFSFLNIKPAVPKHSRSYLAAVFQWLLVTYLALLLVSQFYELLFNLNYVLVIVLATGVLTVVFPAKEKRAAKRTRWDIILVWALGVLGAVLVYLKTASLGWLQYVLAILAGALIVLLGYLVYEDEKKEKPVYLPLTQHVVLYTLTGLFMLASVLTFWLGFDAFRIVFGSVYVLFVPGFILSYVFFETKAIDALERIALSFALSIAVVPLVVFYLNLIGVRISALSVCLVVAGICIVSYVVYWKKQALRALFTHAKRR